MLKPGDFVVHSMEGVCEIRDVVKMTRGRDEVLYYQLSSWPKGRTTVYVPVQTNEKTKARIRKVMSKDEVRDIFQDMLNSEEEWISDISSRQEHMLNIMREGNPYDMARMCKMLMKKDLEKPLGSRDKATLLTAQKVLFSEIAMVTGQDFRTIQQSIKQNLKDPNVELPFFN